MSEKTLTLEEAHQEVSECLERLVAATIKVDQAQREETACLNAYNKACKVLDAAVEKLRESAPSGTDWRNKRTKGGGVG